MSVIQIAILGVIGVVFAIQLKQEKAEVAVYLCIVLSLIVFFTIFEQLEYLVNVIRSIGDFVKIEATYLGTLMKMLGITYLAEFSSSICKDAGYQAIATQIEIFSKLSILVLSMPILITLLKTIQEFLV